MRLYIWQCLLLFNWTSVVLSKVYKFPINTKTAINKRQWTRSTHDDLGGWLVRIVNGNGHFACCGAYIAPLLVVTSANCIEPYRNNLADASAEGIAMLDGEDNFSFIETVYIPDQFKVTKNLMDIAVIRLRRPIKGKLTEFIKLCEQDINDSMMMTSFGWGYSSFSIQAPSLDPRNSTVPVQDINMCKQKFSKYRRVTISKSVFCVTHPTDRRQCLYDPGCPLVWNNQLCGIVSIDSTCVDPSKPGVYTNINQVKEFIEKIDEEVRGSRRSDSID
ncbi:seminase-like [Drosophila sulfurigaster albostrigata]|uniref:seminase-like n=1 Tax=Drosophila sulfurigaster albostrigata TaxID=89887 RepID=UPI002D21C067|nr:seminase-like [Drosophila sulfurigaster albostrigata]